MKTRRSFLSLGCLTAAGVSALSWDNPPFLSAPRWLGNLKGRLRSLAIWTRMDKGADGVPELHCGVHRVEKFAHQLPLLTDGNTQILAAGNSLTLTIDGNPVRVVMHKDCARV